MLKFQNLLLLIIIVGFSSCKNKNDINIQTKLTINDTIKRFVVDDYPVTKEMFSLQKKLLHSGTVYDVQGIWFSNDTLKQTIVFVLDSEQNRNEIYIFNNDNAFNSIRMMYLENDSGSSLATDRQIYENYKGFLTQTTIIKSKYFISNKGVKLGSNKQEVIAIYGEPTTTLIEGEYEQLVWSYVGDKSYHNEIYKGQKIDIVAKNSYGHRAVFIFKNDILESVYLENLTYKNFPH